MIIVWWLALETYSRHLDESPVMIQLGKKMNGFTRKPCRTAVGFFHPRNFVVSCCRERKEEIKNEKKNTKKLQTKNTNRVHFFSSFFFSLLIVSISSYQTVVDKCVTVTCFLFFEFTTFYIEFPWMALFCTATCPPQFFPPFPFRVCS